MKTWLFARLSEAATWGGLSSFALLVLTQLPDVARPYDMILAAAFAGLAVAMKEKGTKTPEQIAADAFAAAEKVRSAATPVAALVLAAGAALLACVTAAVAVPAAPLPVESVTSRAVLIAALLVIATLWILAIALFVRPYARPPLTPHSFGRAGRTNMIAVSGLVLAGGLCGCSPPQISNALTAAGVKPATAQTVASDAVEAGTLFCEFGPTIAAVSGVKVNGATSQAVADACGKINVAGASVTGAVPVPPPATPTAVPVATVATDVALAVIASIGK